MNMKKSLRKYKWRESLGLLTPGVCVEDLQLLLPAHLLLLPTLKKLLTKVMMKWLLMGSHTTKASRKKEKKRQELVAQRQEIFSWTQKQKTQHEEEARAQKAKEEEAAALEFSIDAEGTTEVEEEDGSQGLLFDFVEYIKKHKCVPLEDIAAEFKLRTQDCINRISSLETMGRLSGVMDDRGKYIYISLEEMKSMADYMNREGRVSISHLASKSTSS